MTIKLKLPEWSQDAEWGWYVGARPHVRLQSETGQFIARDWKGTIHGPFPTAALAFRALGIEVEEETK